MTASNLLQPLLTHRSSLAGAAVGVLAGLPEPLNMLFLALLGGVIGHLIDRLGGSQGRRDDCSLLIDIRARLAAEGSRSAFCRAQFLLLGRLAKLDGRVSSTAIGYATRYMEELGLSVAEQERAQGWFSAGKAGGKPLDDALYEFRLAHTRSYLLRRYLIERSIDFVLEDGRWNPAVRAQLERAAQHAGFFPSAVTGWYPLITDLRQWRRETAARRGRRRETDRTDDADRRGRASSQGGGADSAGAVTATAPTALAAAYALLGVQDTDPDRTIQLAWRRLLSQHHPDKLEGRGASAREIERARVMTRRLIDAHEVIRSARARRGDGRRRNGRRQRR